MRSMGENGYMLPDGYYLDLEGRMLFSSEPRLEPMCKAHWSGKARRRELGPRPICGWNGDGIEPDTLHRIAALDRQSRQSSDMQARGAAFRELAAIFRG